MAKEMRIRRTRIAGLADKLLKLNKIDRPLVPIERVAKSQGLLVRRLRNEESDISGFLLTWDENVIVGVNASTHPVRQRFTIAHELGHYLLHAPSPGQIHIDRMFKVIFRDDLSGKGVDREEREANYFAAELLMPRRFITKDLFDANEVDYVEDRFIEDLAKRYGVSRQAMTFRLANLEYIII
jgi:Zn-dependent peptidase ImmA (M78 family)